MQFNPRYAVGDKVWWITNLVVPCETCGHFTPETERAVWGGEVVSVMYEQRKHTVNPIPSLRSATDMPPEFDEHIQYQVRPDGEHNAGNLVLSEATFFDAEGSALRALDREQSDEL